MSEITTVLRVLSIAGRGLAAGVRAGIGAAGFFLALGCLCLGQPAAPTTAAVDVLFIGGSQVLTARFIEACAHDGVRCFTVPAGATLEEWLTPENFAKFHAVVVGGALGAHQDNMAAYYTDSGDKILDLLDQYYRAGGGILWVPFGESNGGTQWSKHVGARYDVTSLEEDIYDPGKVVHANPEMGNQKYYQYIWTTQVARHPVTEGVRGVFLPLLGEHGWPGTVPMQFGRSWQALVKGMDSTVTIGNAGPAGGGIADFTPQVKGTYSSSPEIVGVREGAGGAGRMMVYPFYITATWGNFGHWALKDAMMVNGAGGYSSDGLRLFLNGCRWLAEPARQAGLGGYTPPPEKGRTIVPSLDWAKTTFPTNSWGRGAWFNQNTQDDYQMTDLVTPNGRNFRGVIGVRTAASDGEGTVAEYVAEARKGGLSFIVFLEDLEKTDDARFAALVSDCQANMRQDFAAIPGYLFRDTRGNRHYIFSDKVKMLLPTPDNLTADRRVIAPNNLLWSQTKMAAVTGLAGLGQMSLDPSYLICFSSMAPYVYEADRLVDNGLDQYRAMEGMGYSYPPISLNIIRRPTELSAAVAKIHLTVIHAEQPSAARDVLLVRGPAHPYPVYISNGPRIIRCGMINPIGHPYAPGKQRVRFALEAESGAGIADVELLDLKNGTIFRHFRPNGSKTFACTVDETHKDQWLLEAVVTDVNGNTAVSSTLKTYQDGNRIWLMGDHNDGMHHAHVWDENRHRLVMVSGWLGHPWTKSGASGLQGCASSPPNTREHELVIQGIDGAKVYGPHAMVQPQVVMQAGTEPKIPAFRFLERLASFDFAVADYLGDAQFLVRPKQKADQWWETMDPQVPMERVTIRVRSGAVHPRANAPVSAKLNEVGVTFKQDGVLRRIDFCRMWRSHNNLPLWLMLKDQEGEFVWQDEDGRTLQRDGVLEAGGYVYHANDPGGSVGLVNLGPEPFRYEYGQFATQFSIDGNNRPVKAGESITVRFLTFMRPRVGQNNNYWLKRFLADYAIGGGQPGYRYEVTQGRLRHANYALHLEPENGGATIAVQKYDLPHNLLVTVGNLPANAIVGRYDRERKQLLILPVFEETTTTSLNTTLGDTRLYIGELFHCDPPEARLSCVQDGADRLLLEVHNPTEKPIKANLAAVPGFTPLAGFQRTLDVTPYASAKLELVAAAGSLVDEPYHAD